MDIVYEKKYNVKLDNGEPCSIMKRQQPKEKDMFKPSPQVKITLITPDKAAQLLENNTHNRKVSTLNVRKYATAMTQGKWHANGDPIRIDKDGRLLDGQHRLQAIIQSGIEQTMVLITNLDPECFTTIDTGRLRNLSDILSIEGHSKYVTLKAAGIRFIYELCQGKEASAISGGVKLSHEEALAFARSLDGYYSEIDDLGRLTVAVKLLGSQAAASLYYLLGLVNRRMRNDFFRYLDTGADMPRKHPVLVLRGKLISTRGEGSGRASDIVPWVLSAWKAFKKGDEVGYLKAAQNTSLESMVGKKNSEFLAELAKVIKN